MVEWVHLHLPKKRKCEENGKRNIVDKSNKRGVPGIAYKRKTADFCSFLL